MTQPHLVDSDRVVLRDGVFHELVIPLHAVVDVRVERGANLGRRRIKHSGPGKARMALSDTTDPHLAP